MFDLLNRTLLLRRLIVCCAQPSDVSFRRIVPSDNWEQYFMFKAPTSGSRWIDVPTSVECTWIDEPSSVYMGLCTYYLYFVVKCNTRNQLCEVTPLLLRDALG